MAQWYLVLSDLIAASFTSVNSAGYAEVHLRMVILVRNSGLKAARAVSISPHSASPVERIIGLPVLDAVEIRLTSVISGDAILYA